MSCLLDLLRCLLCCEDEHADHYQISLGSSYRRIFSHTADYDEEAQQAAPSRYSYSSSPNSSTTPKLSSTSFLHHHYSYPDVKFDNSSVSPPPYLSYKPPTPQYYSSNNKPLVNSRIGQSSSASSTSTSSSSPKKPLQPKPTSSSDHSKHPQPFSPKSLASPSSPKPPPAFKSILSNASSSSSNGDMNQRQRDGKKSTYVSVDDDSIPVFLIPEDIKDLIKRDIVPQVLNRPLSQTTYKDFFAALLYSEEFYLEKWSDFLLKNVTLELDKATVYKKRKKEDKTFVTFELDSVKERRPFLLSRDLVFAKPLGKTSPQPFQGIIHRLVSRTRILVEFEDDFYTRHHPNQKYDISFSFNRVCLKRAHQAIETASDALFKDFLFSSCNSRAGNTTAPALLSTPCHQLDRDQRSAVGHILSIQGSPPCLVSGTDCVNDWRTSHNQGEISRTGVAVSEAVYQLYHKSPENRILICAPTNSCCDVLMRSLVKKAIPESAMFRANAAFREKDEVPEDIFRSSLYRQSCFSCPPIDKLKKYRVIFSTYISSYRLHDKGIAAGHFSHMFLVDASSVIEPETLVSLTNFAVKTTSVIVTGQPGKKPAWVRADIAREKGLKISYFERLSESLGPMLITNLNQESDSDHHHTTRNY